MKKLTILLVCVLFCFTTTNAQNIHYYNPAHTLSMFDVSKHEVSLGYNAGFGLLQTVHSLREKFYVSSSLGIRNRTAESNWNPTNEVSKNTLVGQLMFHGLQRFNEGKTGIEGQIGFGATESSYSDQPVNGEILEGSYAENIEFSEKNAQFALILHFYKETSNFYLGIRSIHSRYDHLDIRNSVFKEIITETNVKAVNNGFFIGYNKQINERFSVGTQVGFTVSESRELHQKTEIYSVLFGTMEFTDHAIYSGLTGTAMLKLNYTISPKSAE